MSTFEEQALGQLAEVQLHLEDHVYLAHECLAEE